ncbi:TMV resistance protein N-like protein [Tanacetum coccineum]|uniref:TMV resistance protein N-like protein n=1 Tax=Tanacetum coccineum TaxID=301880 RepID=A0ABQ4ZDH2_9ASTR
MVILSELSEGSSSTSAHRYDVFLSFRGADTRRSFTNHLHKALLDANINTFLDDEEIQTGEDLKPELETAIKASIASIVVLSKNYASSTWCLDELVLILEQRRISKHIVIPIFYHVEPTNVRKQQGSFGDDMAKHIQSMEKEKDPRNKSQRAHKIELWKKALTEVADLKGMNADGWLETKFIEEIVQDLSSRLDLRLQSKIPHVIGMRSSINTITSWLKDGSTHTADILTIWGMAGIGKTSLAKYIYQLHYSDFARSSFIEDIERRCTPKVSSLLDLQIRLLEDIQEINLLKLHDVDLGTLKIEKALLRSRTLLVLDGIDNWQQLDVLVGTLGFHPGSKIIITTKDGSLTEKCGLFNLNVLPRHMKLLLQGLSERESLQLLSWHAFRCDEPKEGYKEESRKVVKHCGGHPLALKVLGSSLRNEDVVAWEDTVALLEKEVNADIQKVLQISFDSLSSENDKELFKHIACFFVGKDREFTETILKECGIRTKFGISKLIDRCLITIGRRNELMMHQLLQDMGRNLVHQESPEKPWKRSRLWRHEDSYNVLKQEKGGVKIQGLVLDMKMGGKDTSHGTSSSIEESFQDELHDKFGPFHLLHLVCKFFSRIWCLFARIFLLHSSNQKKLDLNTNALSKMDKLRLLQLNYVQLHGSYKHFPEGLRWLSMHGSPLSCIPLDLKMENMVALDMSNSNLQQLWKKPKLLPSLKILNLSSSKVVWIGHFSWLPALERLILAGCATLMEVCESIAQCTRLALLDLSYCNMLRRLPRSIRELKKVKILSIAGCSNLDELPEEIKEMESLQVLNANDINIKSQASLCAVVEVLPLPVKSFSLLFPRSLVSLSLRKNNLFNESFPVDFSSLSKLRVLNLSGNPITSLPDCVKSLSALEFLCLQGCHSLKSISCLPTTINFLDANECTSLEKISFHPKLFAACPPNTTESLDASPYSYSKDISFLSSESLTEIEGIRKLQALEDVDDKILNSLGWSDLKLVKSQHVLVFDSAGWNRPKRLPVQMFYEIGIFSTSFRGREIPKWFSHISNGPSVSFTVPSSSHTLRGLNIGFVYTNPDIIPGDWYEVLYNRTKNCTWRYESHFHAIDLTCNESMVCVRHWVIGKSVVEMGDDITIYHECWGEDNVTQCGVSLVYDDGNKDEDPLAIYKPWKYNIGTCKPSDGEVHHDYRHIVSPPPDKFEHVTTWEFWEYIPPNKYMDDLISTYVVDR